MKASCKSILTFLLFLSAAEGYCDWSTPAPISTTSDATNNVITSVTVSGNFLATWQDSTTHRPFFSIYNGTSWTTATTIAFSNLAIGTVVDTAVSSSGPILAVWNTPASAPTYSISSDNGATWSASHVIDAAGLPTFNVFCAASSAGQFIAIWQRASTSQPFFSIYNGTSWSASAAIPGSSPAVTNASIFVSTISSGIYIATWQDNASKDPFYSIYSAGSWSAPAAFGSTTAVNGSIIYNAVSSPTDILATWENGSQVPVYSIYNGTTWTAATDITGGAGQSNIFPSVTSPGQFIATWGNPSPNNFPTYSNYNGTSWSASAAISTASLAGADVFTSVNTSSGEIIATWMDTASTQPFFSIFTPPPLAPGNFTGVQRNNNFGVVSELYNTLSWSSSPGATGYSLYRNGTLIATLGPNTLSYMDHNQSSQPETYTLVAFNANGTSSSSTTTVRGK